MTGRDDATVVTLRFADGRGQRFEIEPREDGGFEVEERILTKGGDWKFVGTEPAESVSIED
jgi:hypothetical protein